ncbi:hypothetical protein Pfo_024270 [Paulownia fortunei]|nr:hypothetical protein Pfo_024270 [Paulownia fortunei]
MVMSQVPHVFKLYMWSEHNAEADIAKFSLRGISDALKHKSKSKFRIWDPYAYCCVVATSMFYWLPHGQLWNHNLSVKDEPNLIVVYVTLVDLLFSTFWWTD